MKYCPIALGQRQQLRAHGGGERRRINALFKQAPVDVGEQSKLFSQRLLAFVKVFVERDKQRIEHCADVRAVFMSVKLN